MKRGTGELPHIGTHIRGGVPVPASGLGKSASHRSKDDAVKENAGGGTLQGARHARAASVAGAYVVCVCVCLCICVCVSVCAWGRCKERGTHEQRL